MGQGNIANGSAENEVRHRVVRIEGSIRRFLDRAAFEVITALGFVREQGEIADFVDGAHVGSAARLGEEDIHVILV